MLRCLLISLCLLGFAWAVRPSEDDKDVKAVHAGELCRNADLENDWVNVKKVSQDNWSSQRVTRADFIDHYAQKYSHKIHTGNQTRQYKSYLEKLFDAAWDMMLADSGRDAKIHKETYLPTLGGHCFRYAGALAGEYYFEGKDPTDQPAIWSEQNPQAYQQLAQYWKDATWKGPFGRITRADFKSKMQSVLGDCSGDFVTFLGSVFDVAWEMMNAQGFAALQAKRMPDGDGTLGQHCFRCAAIMAQEFYFRGKSPADRFGLTKDCGLPLDNAVNMSATSATIVTAG